MKVPIVLNIIISLIVLELWLQDISCNDFLSKFHQNGYKLRDLRAELISCNKKYFNSCEMKTFKFNRTTAVVNVTANMKVAVKDKTEVLVQIYKFLSNEYRHFPVRFQVSLKKVAEANVMGIKAISNCGNLTSFYFEKDVTYHICNFVVDETLFPPLMPNGRYRVDTQALYLNEEIAFLYLYGEVYTPIPYPKK